VPWLKASSTTGNVKTEQRIWFFVNWQAAPAGKQTIPINIKANNTSFTVYAVVNNIAIPAPGKAKSFIEYNGYISIEASDFTNAFNSQTLHWQTIPQIGKTGNGVTMFPVTAKSIMPSAASPCLSYNIQVFDTGYVTINAFFSPTINFNSTPLRYGISFDDEAPRVFNITADTSQKAWALSVADNIKVAQSKARFITAGKHVVKFWYVDAGVVLQKIVIDMGGVKQSYLGPPETLIK
jgi:hypothetical protein